jgi:hypothetical protein
VSEKLLTRSAAALAAALLGLAAPRAQAAPPATGADSLRWLSGCWQFERDGRRVREQWMPPDGGALLGMSRTVKDGAVLEFEFVRIETRDGVLHYVAKPSGQAEAAFALARSGPEELLFENLQHDFPQRIGYRRQSKDALLAWVEATRNGRERRLEFPYQRVPCE